MADDASKMAHTTDAFKKGTTSASTLRPWKAFLDMEILKTGPSPAVRQAFERTLGPILKFLQAANPYLLAFETASISGSTYDPERANRNNSPQENIDKYTSMRDSMFTTEAGMAYYQNLIDKQQQILDKMPDKANADAANQALVWADDGQGKSLGINVHNTGELADATADKIEGKGAPRVQKGLTQDLNIAADAEATARQGVRELITSGEINAQNLAQSFAGSLASKATDKAVDAVWNWGSSMFGGFFGAANGGIAPGGFRAFANGGTVDKPTLGLIGEGKYNEAVVPLPDGRSIPVMGSTGGNTENNVTVNVNIDSDGSAQANTDSGMDGDKAKQLGYMVSQAVQAELVEQKRPGGLLSSY